MRPANLDEEAEYCVVGDYTFMLSQPLTATSLIPGVVVAHGAAKGRAITAKVIQQGGLNTFLEKEGKVLHVLHNRPHPVFPKLRTTVESESGVGFVVMDDVTLDLNTYIKANGALIESEAKHIFRQLLTAVHHCHQNKIVLRDIKLSKIFFNDDSCTSVVIGDLDGAEVVSSSDGKLQDQRGSPAYVGPEVLSGRPYDGYAADIWSLGVVLYRLLTGTYPFQGTKPAKLFNKILKGSEAVNFPVDMDKGAQDLISKLLNGNPGARPDSVELLQDSWLTSEGSSVSLARRRSAAHLDFEDLRSDLTVNFCDQVVPNEKSDSAPKSNEKLDRCYVMRTGVDGDFRLAKKRKTNRT